MTTLMKFLVGLGLLVGAFALFIWADDSANKTSEILKYIGSAALVGGAFLVWFKVPATDKWN